MHRDGPLLATCALLGRPRDGDLLAYAAGDLLRGGRRFGRLPAAVAVAPLAAAARLPRRDQLRALPLAPVRGDGDDRLGRSGSVARARGRAGRDGGRLRPVVASLREAPHEAGAAPPGRRYRSSSDSST